MAKRRCFSIDFYESDVFLNISNDAKALYLGLLLRADDDGAVINHNIILKLTRIPLKTLEELYENNLLLNVDGVCIIKHWLCHNKIQPTRKVDSIFQKELEKLSVTQTKEYILKEQSV